MHLLPLEDLPWISLSLSEKIIKGVDLHLLHQHHHHSYHDCNSRSLLYRKPQNPRSRMCYSLIVCLSNGWIPPKPVRFICRFRFHPPLIYPTYATYRETAGAQSTLHRSMFLRLRIWIERTTMQFDAVCILQAISNICQVSLGNYLFG